MESLFKKDDLSLLIEPNGIEIFLIYYIEKFLMMLLIEPNGIEII